MKTLAPLFGLLLFTSCVHKDQTAQNPHRSTDQRVPAAVQASGEPTLDSNRFLELLNRYQPRTIDQTLDLLREHYPRYLSYHTFIYNSFSLQGSSLQAPRAVVFGPESRFVFSFGGDRSIKGFDVIEMMQFNDQEKTFEFREVQFPQDKTSLTEDEIDPNAVFAVSPVNGKDQKCLMCHGTPPRPNVSTYPFYPGFYGSHDDFRISGAISAKDSMMPELNAYKDFMSGNRNQGRYAKLPPLFSADGAAGKIETSRPNYRFTQNLNYLNGERIARLMKNDPVFSSQKKTVIRTLLCEDVPYLPTAAGFDLDHLNRPMTTAETYVLGRIESTAKSDGARNNDNFGIRNISRLNLEPNLVNVVTMAKLLEIGKMDKMKVGNWSMPTGGDSFDIESRTGSKTSTSLKTYLLKPVLRELAPELINQLPTGSLDATENTALKQFCSRL